MKNHCCCGLLVAVLSLSSAAPAGAPRELQALWDDLAGTDAGRAYAAMWAFMRTPEKSIAFFEAHLKPAVAPERKQVEGLIDDLNNDRFTVRDQANAALEKLGDLAAGNLSAALKGGRLALEARQRVEKLLKKLRGPVTSPQRLRDIRAVETIEYIGSPGARKLLERLAQGAAGARLTLEAQEALGRLRGS